MAKTLTEIMKALPRARRDRIEAKAAREAEEIMKLHDIRTEASEELEDAPARRKPTRA